MVSKDLLSNCSFKKIRKPTLLLALSSDQLKKNRCLKMVNTKAAGKVSGNNMKKHHEIL